MYRARVSATLLSYEVERRNRPSPGWYRTCEMSAEWAGIVYCALFFRRSHSRTYACVEGLV